MKKLFYLLLAVLPLVLISCDDDEPEPNAPSPDTPDGIKIDSNNFPDPAFTRWLKEQTWGADNIITDEEIENIVEITIPEMDIKSLDGVRLFANLKSLRCEYNELATLDVSDLKNLKYLSCNNNKLNSLVLSGCSNLLELN